MSTFYDALETRSPAEREARAVHGMASREIVAAVDDHVGGRDKLQQVLAQWATQPSRALDAQAGREATSLTNQVAAETSSTRFSTRSWDVAAPVVGAMRSTASFTSTRSLTPTAVGLRETEAGGTQCLYISHVPFDRLGLPTLIVMEGGYAVEEIGVNAVGVLTGFEDR